MTNAMIMQHSGWRGWTARMLLPVLLLIAFVPRGYMPDAGALGRGVLALTLCRVVTPPDDSGNPQVLDHGGGCPFALMPALSAPVDHQGAAVSTHWVMVPAGIARELAHRGMAWMAGLGARGPPSF